MAWIVGIDEAGYGPNLGPFVMSRVSCRVPDELADANLWAVLGSAVRRGEEDGDGRLLIDDSKVVYCGPRGLRALERGVLATLWPGVRAGAATLASLVGSACEGGAELLAETWYTGASPLPVHAGEDELGEHRTRFDRACAGAGVAHWQVRSVVVCPRQFNALVSAKGSKGAVLAEAMACLLRGGGPAGDGEEGVTYFVDKHGGRNAYAAQLNDALPAGMAVAVAEGMARSVYRVHGLGRPVVFTFQPRADREHFCVALASMASKYLRELLMGEFNAFWQARVPGLKATAGYPGDAERFWKAIRPAARKLKLPEEAIWRCR
jgi:hypothetical protein